MQITGSTRQFIWLLAILAVAILFLVLPIGEAINQIIPCKQDLSVSAPCSIKYSAPIWLVAFPVALVTFISAVINRIVRLRKK